MYHKPVLLKESIEGLSIKPNGIYVDVTYGGGGHSAEILKRLRKGKLIGFEQDEEALLEVGSWKLEAGSWKLEVGSWKLWEEKGNNSILLVNNNFRYIKNILNYNNIERIDGLIGDLGISSYQIDTAERGFSTRFSGELDMRMNKNKKLTAKTIVNEYSEEELKQILIRYGEVSNAGEIARAIVKRRIERKIETTEDLSEAINKLEVGSWKLEVGSRAKTLAKVFQAIRIVVNDELESLKEMLLQTVDLISPKGRLVIISYHSLEDRLVKNFMRAGNFEGEIKKDFYGNQIAPFKQVNKNIITPCEEEIRENSRARSAKLRIAERQ